MKPKNYYKYTTPLEFLSDIHDMLVAEDGNHETELRTEVVDMIRKYITAHKEANLKLISEGLLAVAALAVVLLVLLRF